MFPSFIAQGPPFVDERGCAPFCSLDRKPFRAKGRHPFRTPTEKTIRKQTVMRIFKADFYRYFAFGFAGGALLVLGAMGIGQVSPLSNDLVPSAQAAQDD